jgi:hypothetical protein
MADYCGGEYCCPTINYGRCKYCNQPIKRYPNRTNIWRHPNNSHDDGNVECADWEGNRREATPIVANEVADWWRAEMTKWWSSMKETP